MISHAEDCDLDTGLVFEGIFAFNRSIGPRFVPAYASVEWNPGAMCRSSRAIIPAWRKRWSHGLHPFVFPFIALGRTVRAIASSWRAHAKQFIYVHSGVRGRCVFQHAALSQ